MHKVKCNKIPSLSKDQNKAIIALICKTRFKGNIYV